MPVTSVEKDLNNVTLTVVAEFAAPARRVWDAYADPRQIERFWGPPQYPATFLRHDVAEGGRSVYKMTGTEGGDTHYGCWDWTSVNAPHSFEVEDRFANENGEPNSELPTTHVNFAFEDTDSGSKLTTTSRFDSVEQLQQLVDMGMLEGMREAMGQIDSVLADLAAFANDRGAEAQILSDTQVRVARVIRGSVDEVWRAHNDAELMKQWLLGPDGWTMPVCEIATNVGDTYRYEWAPEGGGEGFGFTGELLEVDAPTRAVTTEKMIATDFPGTVNELTLTPVEGGTLLTMVATYVNAEQRDAILATGMVDGMETSYERLEGILGASVAR